MASPDIRRMTVHSLLSGPPGPRGPQADYKSHPPGASPSIDSQLSYSREPRYYGVDRGLPDLDLGKNDDDNAISSGSSPLLQRDHFDTLVAGFDSDLFSTEFAFGLETNDMFEDTGGYYDKPVSQCGLQ